MNIIDTDPGGPWSIAGRKGTHLKAGTTTGNMATNNANSTGAGGLKTTGMLMDATVDLGTRIHTGIIQVRFMTIPGKNINIAKAIKDFVAAARQADPEFSIIPMDSAGATICSAREVPNDKTSIDKYYKHIVKPNNVCGTMRVWMKKKLSEMKSPKYSFRNYLRVNQVYINLAQLGEVEGITVGWVFKGHPAFTDRESIKDNIKMIMGEEYEHVRYAVFPKNIRYKRESDGARLNTHAIAIQIPKSDNIDANLFRTTLAKNWKESTPITGGSLHGKMFIPLGKDSNIQDGCMTNVVKQQNEFITETRQRIVSNLENIDRIIDIHVETESGPEPTKVTIRNRLSQIKDATGKKLFTGLEKTQTEGTYRFMFHSENAKLADECLDDIERTLENMGDWSSSVHQYRLDEHKTIQVVGKVMTTTADPYWNEYFADFTPIGIPSQIDMKSLRHTNKRKKWATASYSDIARGANISANGTATPTTAQTSYGSTFNEGTLPSLTATTAGTPVLSLLEQRMTQIDNEREKFITEQKRLSDELTSAATSMLRLTEDIVNIRTDMQTLGSDLKGNMLSISKDVKELKEALLLLYKNNNVMSSPKRTSKRKAAQKAKDLEEEDQGMNSDMEDSEQEQDPEECSVGSRRTSKRGFQLKNQY